jgi:hypothetical protein
MPLTTSCTQHRAGCVSSLRQPLRLLPHTTSHACCSVRHCHLPECATVTPTPGLPQTCPSSSTQPPASCFLPAALSALPALSAHTPTPPPPHHLLSHSLAAGASRGGGCCHSDYVNLLPGCSPAALAHLHTPHSTSSLTTPAPHKGPASAQCHAPVYTPPAAPWCHPPCPPAPLSHSLAAGRLVASP